MPCQTVCISAADGTAADEVGRLVATQLGFRLVNEQVIARAAQQAGVAPGAVADVERRRSFVKRMLEDLAPGVAMTGVALGGVLPYDDRGPGSDDLRSFIRDAIADIAAEGETVIVTHAASLALAHQDSALRVLVTASPATRCRRLVEAQGIDDAQAMRLVKETDAARAHYLKRFYDVSSELPTHYDLVVNTDRLTPQRAAELVVRTAQA